MLEALRRGTASWIAKGLLLLLVFAFAIWGVADVFRGYGRGSLAKVGSTEISTDEFERTYRNQMEEVRRRFGGRLTSEQIRAFGLDTEVLSRMIGGAAIDAHASELGLAISAEKVADAVRSDPTFAGAGGRFDRQAFEALIRQSGFTEQGYLQLRRRETVREQLTETLLSAVQVPAILVDTLYRYREETRSVSHFTIDPGKIALAPPEEAKLKETFESNARQFVIPEFRKLQMVVLSGDTVRKSLPIADADIAKVYDRDRETFAIAERRRILQIPFKDKAAAAAAKAAIDGGTSFVEAAKAAGASETDIDLGLRTRRELIDARIADVAFALPKDKVSEPVEGQFTTVLLKVTEIEPGRQKPLEEVKGEIRDRLAADKAQGEIQTLHDEVDRQRGAGKPLKEVAAALKLPFVEVAETDRNGLKPDGKPAFELADGKKIAAAAFEGAVGLEIDAVELADGGYVWLEVLAVTPERQKSFEDVKAEVRTLWEEAERRRLIAELAAKLAERAGKGESLEGLAAEAGGKVETTTGFKRFGAQPSLPETAVTLAFSLPKGRAASAETKDRASRIVLRVDDIAEAPAPSKEDAERLRTEVLRQRQGDVLAEYVAALQDRLGVTINQVELRRATGAEPRP